jgi:hypothetical protein
MIWGHFYNFFFHFFFFFSRLRNTRSLLCVIIHRYARGHRSFIEHYDIVLFLKTSQRLLHADYRVSHRKSLEPPFLRVVNWGGGVLFFSPPKPFDRCHRIIVIIASVSIRQRTTSVTVAKATSRVAGTWNNTKMTTVHKHARTNIGPPSHQTKSPDRS